MLTTETTGYAGDIIDMTGCYDYWHEQRHIVYPPASYTFCSHTTEDKGLKALSIIKVLIKKKLAKIDTIGQFVDIMDELVKIL